MTPRAARDRNTAAGMWPAVGCACLLAILNAAAAWYSVFSHFAGYDDEGYFISTLRSLFGGRAIYDRVETMYGPLYYCYQWVAHVWMRVLPTSDSMRMVTIFFWTLSALAAYWLVIRLTRSLLFAVLANWFTFHALGYLAPEHGHPQEMVMVLLLAIPLAAGLRSGLWMAAVWGVLAGALLALKINVGVYAVVAIGLILTRRARPRLLFFAAAAAALLLPAAVMARRLSEHWALLYCLIVTCSTLGPVVTLASKKSPLSFGVTAFSASIGGFFLALASSAAFCLAHGSTAHGMFANLIVLPQQMMGGWWFRPVPMRLICVAPALAGPAIAIYRARRGSAPPGLSALKLAVAVSVLSCGVAGWWDTLLLIGAPFLWMVAVDADEAMPGSTGWGPRMTMVRSTLLAVATATLLYPYPVAGSQMRLADCLVLVVEIVCLYDLYPALVPWLYEWNSRKRALAYGVLGCLLAATYCRDVWSARNEYRSDSPLGFEGAARMRIEPEQAALLRSMIANVPASCDLLLTAPGMFSINLWAKRPAPQRLVIRTFTGAQDGGEQEEIIREMSSHPGSCVIFNVEQGRFWSRGHDVSPLPLVRFIEDRYAVRWQGGGYQLSVAK